MMKLRSILTLLTMIVILCCVHIIPTYAQVTSVYCGSVVTSEFTQDSQVILYQILLNVEDRINISANGESSTVLFDLWLYGPTDSIIGGSNPGEILYGGSPSKSTPSFRSGTLSASGLYTIRLTNSHFYPSSAAVYVDNESDSVGSFTFYIDCIHDGQPIPAGTPVPITPEPVSGDITVTMPIIRSQSVTPLQCGQMVASEFTQSAEMQQYSVDISAEDQAFWVTVTPIGDYLYTSMLAFAPTSDLADGSAYAIQGSPAVRVEDLRSGSYIIVVGNRTLSAGLSETLGETRLRTESDYPSGGIGLYVIGAGCQFADGTIVNPGDVQPPTQQPQIVQPDPAATTTSSVTSCPNSPSPRLSVGLPGKVTPGDANNIRTEPGGTTVIGQLPAGEQFTVLEGPVCGSNGLTYWWVQYGDLTGWTAEGEGPEYWLEPVQSGRG